MTDPSEASETPEVAQVRRLLAEARHRDPMPDDVASRMDDVLAGLGKVAAEKPAPPQRDGVVPISAARRRRAGALLVAAAVVVGGGIVIAPHLPNGSTASPTTASDTGGSTLSGALGDTPPSQKGPESGSTVPKSLDDAGPLQLRDGLVVVHPRRFSADALRSRALLSQSRALLDRASCPAVPVRADVVAARYERAPAALVYRRARGGSQVVDLYICGSPRPVRSTTLPVDR
jgi:hypothetical protein